MQWRGKKDDPPRFANNESETPQRTVKDDIRADYPAGKEVAFVSGLVRRLFRSLRCAALLRIYVQGRLSNVHRKTAEAIALQLGKAPRTLQRFLESIKWDETKLRDRCQQIVARDHATLSGWRRRGWVQVRRREQNLEVLMHFE